MSVQPLLPLPPLSQRCPGPLTGEAWCARTRTHTYTRQALSRPRPSSPPYSPPSAPPPSCPLNPTLPHLTVPPASLRTAVHDVHLTHTLRFSRRHRRRCHSGSGFVARTRLPRTTHLTSPPLHPPAILSLGLEAGGRASGPCHVWRPLSDSLTCGTSVSGRVQGSLGRAVGGLQPMIHL